MSMWLKVACMFDWPCMERFASHAIVISHHVNAMPHNALRPGRHLQPLLSSPGRSCQTWPRHEEGPIGVRGPKGQMGEHFSLAGALFGGHYYSISGALLLDFNHVIIDFLIILRSQILRRSGSKHPDRFRPSCSTCNSWPTLAVPEIPSSGRCTSSGSY